MTLIYSLYILESNTLGKSFCLFQEDKSSLKKNQIICFQLRRLKREAVSRVIAMGIVKPNYGWFTLSCVSSRHSQKSELVWLQLEQTQNSHHLMLVGSLQVTDILQMVNYPRPGTDTLPSLACPSESLSSS